MKNSSLPIHRPAEPEKLYKPFLKPKARSTSGGGAASIAIRPGRTGRQGFRKSGAGIRRTRRQTEEPPPAKRERRTQHERCSRVIRSNAKLPVGRGLLAGRGGW